MFLNFCFLLIHPLFYLSEFSSYDDSLYSLSFFLCFTLSIFISRNDCELCVSLSVFKVSSLHGCQHEGILTFHVSNDLTQRSMPTLIQLFKDFQTVHNEPFWFLFFTHIGNQRKIDGNKSSRVQSLPAIKSRRDKTGRACNKNSSVEVC